MTPRERELTECLARLVDRFGAQLLSTAYPMLAKRIEAALQQTEKSA
jgi:hypothetical protein